MWLSVDQVAREAQKQPVHPWHGSNRTLTPTRTHTPQLSSVICHIVIDICHVQTRKTNAETVAREPYHTQTRYYPYPSMTQGAPQHLMLPSWLLGSRPSAWNKSVTLSLPQIVVGTSSISSSRGWERQNSAGPGCVGAQRAAGGMATTGRALEVARGTPCLLCRAITDRANRAEKHEKRWALARL